MKGGSVASNAVSGLIDQNAYNALTKNFSNFTNAGKCGGSKSRKTKKGGTSDPLSAVSNAVAKALSSTFNKGAVSEGFNVFKSVPSAVGSEYANLRGNAKGGTKNMSELRNNASIYSVRNRRGGTLAKNAGLDYSSIASTSKMYGQVTARTTPNAVNRLMATNSASSLPALNKTAMYGSTSNNAHNFSYASADKIVGGKKKVAKKSKSKKPCKAK